MYHLLLWCLQKTTVTSRKYINKRATIQNSIERRIYTFYVLIFFHRVYCLILKGNLIQETQPADKNGHLLCLLIKVSSAAANYISPLPWPLLPTEGEDDTNMLGCHTLIKSSVFCLSGGQPLTIGDKANPLWYFTFIIVSAPRGDFYFSLSLAWALWAHGRSIYLWRQLISHSTGIDMTCDTHWNFTQTHSAWAFTMLIPLIGQ